MENSKGGKSNNEKYFPVERSEIHEHFRTIDTTDRSDGGHEIRAREHNQISLEESSTSETTRKATHEEMMAIMNAQFYGFDEFQLSKNIDIKDIEKVEIEHNISGMLIGPEGKKVMKSEQYRQEQIIEGPRIGDVTESFQGTTKTEQSNFQQNVVVEDESDVNNISTNINNVSKNSSNLKIDSSTPIYENISALNSLHRIRHKRHVLEEIVLEDVDTFYEDKGKKRHTLTKSLIIESPSDLNKENILEENLVSTEKKPKRFKINTDQHSSSEIHLPSESFSKTYVVNCDMPWIKTPGKEANIKTSSTTPHPKLQKNKIKTGSYSDETKTYIITNPLSQQSEASKFSPSVQLVNPVKNINKKEKSTDCDSALIPLHCVHG